MTIDEMQVEFDKWAKANGYSVARLTRAPRYYQDSHTEAAFQGWIGQCSQTAEEAPAETPNAG